MSEETQVPEGQTPTPEEAAAAEAAAATKPEEEMTEEELTALHADEDFIANFSKEDGEDPEKVTQLNEAILRSAQTTIHQKRHYRTKAGEAKPAAPAAPATPEPKPTAQEKKDEKKVDPQVATDFRLDHPELSKDQQLKVIAHAGAYNVTPEEALKDPMIESYLKSSSTAEDVDEASMAPGHQAGGAIADKDWSTATPAEIEAQRNKMLYPNG